MDKIFNNFDDFKKALKKKADKASGEVSFDVLFDESFMKKYTDFSSFDELLSAGGFIVNSKEDFERIPEDQFDQHIAKTTRFKSWKDMKSTAGTTYMANQLKF